MEYNDDILAKIEKYKKFHKDNRTGQIIATVSPYTLHISDAEKSRIGLTNRRLDSWSFPEDADDFIDYCIEQLRIFIQYTESLDSDYIPNINVGLGIALASAYFSNAEIVFGSETSWTHPVIKQWSDLNDLYLSENNFWYQMLEHMTKRIVSQSEGDYVPSSYCYFGPSDMANALRGNDLFYDYYDFPENVHHLMDIGTDAIIWLHERLQKITGSVMDGSVMADIWLPGNALYLSEDASDLCSREIFNTFNRPYTQKILDHFGSAYIHHHALGKHIHKDIASLNNLNTVELSWDPNRPKPIEDIVNIYRMNPKIPIQTRCTVNDVYEYIDQIKQCKAILMVVVEDLYEAHHVLDFIHRHSII